MPERCRADWERICPSLSIGKTGAPTPLSFSEERLSIIATRFWQDGYINLDPLFEKKEIDALANGFDTLKAANLPPAYIYIFDQPWLLFERLRNLIAHFLSEDYVVLPNLWAWHLSTVGDKGWSPHKDCNSQTVFEIGQDKILLSLSLWIPLSDAGEENGCMYVIPRGQQSSLVDEFGMDRKRLKPYARALPAKAGSVLGWPQDLVHWGGDFSNEATNPRKSLSFEFQNPSFDPLIEPFLDTRNPPPFDQRLGLIKHQFDKYQHMVAD